MEVIILNSLTERDTRKIVMRLGIGGNSLGFWWGRTTNGMSMGPIIPGEQHVQLTFFMNGEVFNAHLKIVEDGKTQYKNLTVMNPHEFEHTLQQLARNMLNSFQPMDTNRDIVLMTNHAHKLFNMLGSGSATVTYKGRTRYLDFDFGTIANEIQNLTENPFEYFMFGKAQNLIDSESFKLGVTEEGIPIFPVDHQIYSWGGLRQTPWGMPFNDLSKIIGIPQLLSEIEQRKLLDNWIKKNLVEIKSKMSSFMF